MNRIEKAIEIKKSGLNCAQAIAMTFSEECGISEEIACKVSLGHGVGMGNTKGTCGAIIGGGTVLGMIYPDTVYQKTRELMKRFEDKNTSTVCSVIKGVGTGKILRDCNGCVEDVAVILEDMIENK